MALEPLNSAMSFQAQPISQVPEVRMDKPAAEYTDSNVQETNLVDSRTVVVDSVAQKDGEGGQGYPQQQSQASREKVRKAVEELNRKMYNSEALFGIHEGTGRVTIKLVDRKTKEVIKELPPEKTLDMIAKVWEIAGIMVDERR